MNKIFFDLNSIKNLNNDSLLEQTHKLISEERRITTSILHHLRVIESRRLYALRGFSSLFEFCVKELKYPEASAQRRIVAMRLLKEIPEIENGIDSGKLNITTIAQVQSFARMAGLNIEEKRETLKAIEGKSKLETEKTLNKLLVDKLGAEKAEVILTTSLQRQTTKSIIPGFSEVKFVVDEELLKLLSRVKALHFHKLKNPESLPELLKLMANQLLDKTDPQRIEKKIEEKKQKNSVSLAEVKSKQERNSASIAKENQLLQKPTRYIPRQIQRQLFVKSNSRCCYVDPKTKRHCEETKGLQIDHIHSHALGGSNQKENLRIYCRSHNFLHALHTFGEKKILSYTR